MSVICKFKDIYTVRIYLFKLQLLGDVIATFYTKTRYRRRSGVNAPYKHIYEFKTVKFNRNYWRKKKEK